jgi:DNA-binding NtrC family response regulator
VNHLFPRDPVLIVDDDLAAVQGLDLLLKSGGITNVIECLDSRQVMTLLGAREVETILLDLVMPHVGGQELLERIRSDFPSIPVIIVTGTNEVTTAVECVKAGAFDYVVKVIDDRRLVSVVRRAIEARGLRRDYRDLSRRFLANRLGHPEAFSSLLTQDKTMHSVFLVAESVAPTSEPVLLTGETGVGKNLLAAAIHAVSGRKGRLVEVNVAGLDDHSFSDALFGHKKGAYTGADSDRKGLIEQARDGTILLNEIGDLGIPAQIKLLQLLDTREYYPLGLDLPRRANARVIAATNRDLAGLMEAGSFRRDLYFRLSTYEIAIPPLRERKGDVPLLFHNFLEEAARELGRAKPGVPPQVLTLLETYHFPGNVREIRRIVFEAMLRQSSNVLSLEPFEKAIGRNADLSTPVAGDLFASVEPLPTITRATDLLVDEALRRSHGNRRIAASMLGISRQALDQRLKRRAERGRN